MHKVSATGEAGLKDLFQSKIKVEWDALKNKDKQAYGALLADDYEGVEVDGQGERTKLQAMNEMAGTNVFNYTLWGYKLIPLGPDAAVVIYEVTMQFPPKSVVRFSRVYITEVWVSAQGGRCGKSCTIKKRTLSSPRPDAPFRVIRASKLVHGTQCGR